MLETYEGSCHCGRVRFRVRADLSTLLECNCSVCTKKGILHLIVPPEQFELLQGRDELATYQFNTNTAKHTFCRLAGCTRSTCRARTRTRSASMPAASTTSIRHCCGQASFSTAGIGKRRSGRGAVPKANKAAQALPIGAVGLSEPARGLGVDQRGQRLADPRVVAVEPGDLVLVEQRSGRSGCGRSAPGSGSRSRASRARPPPSAGCTSTRFSMRMP